MPCACGKTPKVKKAGKGAAKKGKVKQAPKVTAKDAKKVAETVKKAAKKAEANPSGGGAKKKPCKCGKPEKQ